MAQKITPLILSGGSGLRLWPVSRRDYPKQLARLTGERSLFQETAARFADAVFAEPVVLTSDACRFHISRQLAELGLDATIAIEPEPRDTLAAITAGAILAGQRDKDAVVLMAPSDHVIGNAAAFRDAVMAAAQAARESTIVTFGTVPTYPATGYGYVKPGAEAGPAFHAEGFVEKPDKTRAQALIDDGYLWNSGMFCFRARRLCELVAELEPETFEAVSMAVSEAEPDLDFLRLSDAFCSARKISFDYAVMEHADKVAVVTAGFTWSDIGDWREMWNISDKDGQGNATSGDVIVHDGTDNYVRGAQRLVCLIGTTDLAVVDTTDAVLIADKSRAQDIKAVAQRLGEQERPEVLHHTREYRPWGWYQSIDSGDGFKAKRLHVYPGRQLSLQKHEHRSEHWVVIRGTARVRIGDETRDVPVNESVYIPSGTLHRLGNDGEGPLELIEVQTGAYLEEDDIIRIEDDFSR